MSDLPNNTELCENPIRPLTKPRGAVEARSDIALKEESDNFWTKRIIKGTLLLWVVIILSAVAVGFLYNLATCHTFFNSVMNKIMDNIAVVLISGFSILGINFATKK